MKIIPETIPETVPEKNTDTIPDISRTQDVILSVDFPADLIAKKRVQVYKHARRTRGKAPTGLSGRI